MTTENSNLFDILASGHYTPEKHAKFMEWLKNIKARPETNDDDELFEQEDRGYILLVRKRFLRTKRQRPKLKLVRC